MNDKYPDINDPVVIEDSDSDDDAPKDIHKRMKSRRYTSGLPHVDICKFLYESKRLHEGAGVCIGLKGCQGELCP